MRRHSLRQKGAYILYDRTIPYFVHKLYTFQDFVAQLKVITCENNHKFSYIRLLYGHVVKPSLMGQYIFKCVIKFRLRVAQNTVNH